jgi:hypothetical protein
MQKLTLSIDDDIYSMLHQKIGRGNIGRFVSDAIRPHLMNTDDSRTSTAFGGLSSLTKTKNDDAIAIAKAKRAYMVKRYAAKQG